MRRLQNFFFWDARWNGPLLTRCLLSLNSFDINCRFRRIQEGFLWESEKDLQWCGSFARKWMSSQQQWQPMTSFPSTQSHDVIFYWLMALSQSCLGRRHPVIQRWNQLKTYWLMHARTVAYFDQLCYIKTKIWTSIDRVKNRLPAESFDQSEVFKSI